jgi:xylose isomerase
MNRNDYQSGWDTDQFPNNVPEVALAYYYILKGGGFTTGGTNFDAKLRRQSLDPEDLLYGHIGGMDTCARGLKAAAKMVEDGVLTDFVKDARRHLFAGRHRRICREGRRQSAAEIRPPGISGERRQPLRVIAQ